MLYSKGEEARLNPCLEQPGEAFATEGTATAGGKVGGAQVFYFTSVFRIFVWVSEGRRLILSSFPRRGRRGRRGATPPPHNEFTSLSRQRVALRWQRDFEHFSATFYLSHTKLRES
ncbi:MAG: hypothetical protein NZ933_06765 [Bacteroidia bacterium]|nr:hypothetical protein [Bacteroidia bacterium]